ncbi:MAG: hypothetical protein EOS22_09340 [Mesorhizobium sp.]|uniref:hypothetical protein n=1 Tax=Mesorhizobium sp. TaxID=1871066 RepID=UPI000FE607E7|nr:hypothetical protein [Mesorhizobium sp.]RWD29136.1 MAG: hypothetical protein EOS22_09340 [Mesorhizobium sp.]TJW68568.1 MAG: hypothetical protein E5V29_11780 [Mesorhizobium sp.]
MNVANLQLEGLLMSVASINDLLVHKGVLSIDEIDSALQHAEDSLLDDARLYEDMSPSNRDAVCFPLRLLQLANLAQSETEIPAFSELAKMVGELKQPYTEKRAGILG